MFSQDLQKITDKVFTYDVFKAPILPWIILCPEKDVSVFNTFAHYGEINKYVTGSKNNNRYFTGQFDSLHSKHKLVEPLRALSSWIRQVSDKHFMVTQV